MRTLTPVSGALITIVLVAAPAVYAGAPFVESLLQGPYQEMLTGDLDGDQRSDLVLVIASTAHIFFQGPGGRFPGKPSVTFSLGDTHSVLWAARLGRQAYSLLVADHEGIGEWIVRDRSRAPERSTVVSCTTAFPTGRGSITPMTLSARTSGPMPLLLLPVGRDLQIWRHAGTWRRGQVLPDALTIEMKAPEEQVGYKRVVTLDMSVGDVTGDGLDDLIVRKESRGKLTYRVHVQGAGARFSAEPQVTYTDSKDWRTWHSWLDVNRDGNVDLIRSTWLYEPWFLPGIRSGKTLVRVFLADSDGTIPPEPTHALRKNDWTPPVPVVDIDGDGLVDLALGYSPFDSRDGFRKAMTAKQFNHDLLFYFFRPEKGFLPEADFRQTLTLHIDFRIVFSVMNQGGVQRRFFSLMGDFDGDGDRDLLVRDTGDTVSVYPFISRRKGFARRPTIRFGQQGGLERLLVEDLNGDGLGDLLLELSGRQALKLFVSRGKR